MRKRRELCAVNQQLIVDVCKVPPPVARSSPTPLLPTAFVSLSPILGIFAAFGCEIKHCKCRVNLSVSGKTMAVVAQVTWNFCNLGSKKQQVFSFFPFFLLFAPRFHQHHSFTCTFLPLTASPMSHQFNGGVLSKAFHRWAPQGRNLKPTVPGPITARRRGHFYCSVKGLGHFHGGRLLQQQSRLALNYSSVRNRQGKEVVLLRPGESLHITNMECLTQKAQEAYNLFSLLPARSNVDRV